MSSIDQEAPAIQRAPSHASSGYQRRPTPVVPSTPDSLYTDAYYPISLIPPRRSLCGDAEADRAAHAGSTQAAIATGVLGEILLVITLSVVEHRRVEDLGRDLAHAAAREFLLEDRLRGLGLALLLGREGVNAGAILRADIVALAHALGRIVVLPEGLEQRLVGGLRRVEPHLHHLVVAGVARADFLVGRVGRETASIADGGRVDARRLPELALSPPEAAQPEHRLLEAGWKRRLNAIVVHEMLGRHGEGGLVAARQGALDGGHFGFLTQDLPHGAAPLLLCPLIWPYNTAKSSGGNADDGLFHMRGPAG